MEFVKALVFLLFLTLGIKPPASFWREAFPSPSSLITISSPLPLPAVQGVTTATPSAEWYQDKVMVKINRVIDGDTVELEGGRRLRYIGIDTPESVDPRRAQECYGKEAAIKNTELVLGKEVYLEKDVSETDRFGRLLRYVYLPVNHGQVVLINHELVAQGYAEASAYPPDIKYQTVLEQAEVMAQRQKVGFWADQVCQN